MGKHVAPLREVANTKLIIIGFTLPVKNTRSITFKTSMLTITMLIQFNISLYTKRSWLQGSLVLIQISNIMLMLFVIGLPVILDFFVLLRVNRVMSLFLVILIVELSPLSINIAYHFAGAGLLNQLLLFFPSYSEEKHNIELNVDH